MPVSATTDVTKADGTTVTLQVVMLYSDETAAELAPLIKTLKAWFTAFNNDVPVSTYHYSSAHLWRSLTSVSAQDVSPTPIKPSSVNGAYPAASIVIT